MIEMIGFRAIIASVAINIITNLTSLGSIEDSKLRVVQYTRRAQNASTSTCEVELLRIKGEAKNAMDEEREKHNTDTI